MGRPRKDKRFPPYCRNDGSRWIWRPYTNGRLGPPVRLCAADAPVSKVWEAYEKLTDGRRDRNLSWLIERYLTNNTATEKLAKTTIKNYEYYSSSITSRPIQDGMTFGEVPLDAITKRTIRHYLDTYPHPIAANRHMQFLKAAWNWIYEREDIPQNPCTGVKLNLEESRDRYVTDTEYSIVYEIALRRRVKYMPIFMELAYLTRARRHEIARYRKNDLTNKGLRLVRGKGSRGEFTQYSERLNAALAAAQDLHSKTFSPWLIHNKAGEQITKNTFDSAWRRLMDAALKGVDIGDGRILRLGEPFTFHDLKAKGVTDHKTNASGHKSKKAQAIYIRQLPEISATR